jgi:tRNA threonylcarbamoyl adenosine modification protein YeaZ
VRLLALEAASGCSAALLRDETVVAFRKAASAREAPVVLATLVADLLGSAACSPTQIDAVAVCVGPGSFTGLRASLALAHGLSAASGTRLVGVTSAEALAAALPSCPRRELLTAVDAGRAGRVFLALGEKGFVAATLADLPMPPGPIAVAGTAAVHVVSVLAARDADVMLTDARQLTAAGVGLAASLRLAGAIPSIATQPIYVDPPETSLPACGLRQPPVAARHETKS